MACLAGLLLPLPALLLLLGCLVQGLWSEELPVEAAVAADDECSARESELHCTLNALQRRGQALNLALSHAGGVTEVPERVLIKGISYGPMPCKSRCKTEMDDFMTEAAKPLWGRRGRADLRTMRLLGANHVRMYGNNPSEDHSSFLDEAQSEQLKVIVGMSDYPYTQMQGNCMSTGYDCYSLVKAVYRMNLLKGFVNLAEKAYHPALQTMIVINEPDLKLPGINEPRNFARGVISALDGMLDAEAEVGVTGRLVNFTATVSFGVCPNCQAFHRNPALGQLYEIELAMLNPEDFGYTPRNNLSHVYYNRWIHSFNTAAPATFVQTDFLEIYEFHFVHTPVVILEYHTPFKNPYTDFQTALDVARNSSLLLGASFFEFQVRYDKGGSEMDFGMFGLGSYDIQTFDYYGSHFGAWCLAPVQTRYGGSVPELLTVAMDGEGLDYDALCSPDPEKVPLDGDGFAQIASQGAAAVSRFVERIIQHLGGRVVDHEGVLRFASKYAVQASTVQLFGSMIGALTADEGATAQWVSWDKEAKCVADRNADAGSVGQAIGYACSKVTTFNCSEVVLMCQGSVWATADYIFSHYYEDVGATSPLENCYFGGAAIFASQDYLGRRCGGECCNYVGEAPMLPTVAPTLPPVFDPEGSKTGAPSPPPEIAGDCSFKVAPAEGYYWDPNCKPRGGPGCKADGEHMECRYCGFGPFPACPTSPVKPTEAPGGGSNAPSPSVVGNCSFAVAPALPYYWDLSCEPRGGPGCRADGKHLACRLCGQGPFPACPPGA